MRGFFPAVQRAPRCAIVLVFAFVFAACGGGGAAVAPLDSTSGETPPTTTPGTPAGGDNVVTTQGTSFSPASITIQAGGNVVWQITGTTHNVTFGTNKPAGGDVANTSPGGSATRAFPAAGTYDYQCTLHSGMTGTVVVQGTAAAVFTSLAVSPVAPAISVGGTVQITATPRDQNGSAMSGLPAATWSSSADGIARVSASGLVTGVSGGTAIITATVLSGGITKSATATVTVSAPSSANAVVTTPNLTFSPQSVVIGSGGSVTWQFSGSTHNVTFGSLKPQGGDVPDTDPGNAALRTFTAVGTYAYQCTRHSGMTGTVVVQGSGPPGQFTSLSLTPSTAFVTRGGTAQLTATPLDGTGAPLSGLGAPSFMSTNTAIATVSGSGLVTGVANGSASVVASLTVNGVTRADTTAVTVGTASATVTLSGSRFSPETVEIAPGGTVVWEFSVAGNVTFEDEQPPEGNIPQTAAGSRVARTFTASGDYDYYSSPDRGVKGRIRVR